MRKTRNPILLPLVLVVYAIAMASIGYPKYKESGNWSEFWGIIGGCVAAAILLYFVLRKRNKIRNEFNKPE